MIRNILRAKQVWISITFLGVLFLTSMLYPYFKDHLPYPKQLLYNAKHELVGKTPYSPTQVPPFGTDRRGIPLLYKIIEGAKYTIGFSLGIALFRVLIGTCIGVFLSVYSKRFKRFAKSVSETFYNIPTIFIAFILIAPVYISLKEHEPTPSFQWIITLYQLAVGVAVAIPAISVYIADEVDEHMKQDYIINTRLMGASNWYIIRRHIQLFLREKTLILFMQHIVQTLILFVHLGLIHYFIGGERQIVMTDGGEKKYVSLTNEWSGLVGVDRYEFNMSPWIILIPLFAFTVTIFLFNLIAEGIKQELKKQSSASPIQKQQEMPMPQITDTKELFEFATITTEQKRNPTSVKPNTKETVVHSHI